MSKKEKFPKYWCYSQNLGIGGVVRTYREIPDQKTLDRVNQTRETFPEGWKGFITDSYWEAENYAND